MLSSAKIGTCISVGPAVLHNRCHDPGQDENGRHETNPHDANPTHSHWLHVSLPHAKKIDRLLVE